jgi:hypothetical protein
MELTIVVRKTGGLWHGTLEGSTDIDERALTADIAERKAREVAERRYAVSGVITFTVRRVAPEE